METTTSIDNSSIKQAGFKITGVMMKQKRIKTETLTFEYSSCGECSNVDERFGTTIYYEGGDLICSKTKRVIEDLWGKIPDECPLPDKEK